MSKLYPDCDYFNDERDSEFAPDDGECESCYRYEICLTAKEVKDTSIKRMIKNINEVFRKDDES